MDASAYLSKQGWLGTGHSLHPNGRGIKKPLLVSQKSNVLGIGKKEHDVHADRWWARAFDSSLKSLDVCIDKTTRGNGNVTARQFGALDMIKAGGAKWAGKGGLYAGFVRGATLGGTLTPELAQVGGEVREEEKTRKTKMDGAAVTGIRTERRTRKEKVSESIFKEERRKKKGSWTTTTVCHPAIGGDAFMTNSDGRLEKEERRHARRARLVAREERRLTKRLMEQMNDGDVGITASSTKPRKKEDRA